MVPGTIDIYKFGWRKEDKRNEREIGQACKSSTSVGMAGEIRALGQTKADFMVSRCMSSKFLQNQQLEYVIRYLQEGDTTLIEIRIHFAVKSLCRRTPSIATSLVPGCRGPTTVVPRTVVGVLSLQSLTRECTSEAPLHGDECPGCPL